VSPPVRKVIHVDMDAFYAAVEQRDRPELRGRPVVVGGDPRGRGVVATASYEARPFGIHSAMPSAQAYRRCPHAVFLRPDFERYRAVSKQVQAIFRRHTDLVEPLSLDEAYLDVTENARGLPSATAVAEAIRAEVRAETGLTASAGVGPSKLVAKIASDVDKPDGLCVVPPGRVADFLRGLPVRRLPGVGRKTEEACRQHGIETCGDLLAIPEDRLLEWFGSAGLAYRERARGLDPRPVVPERDRKSVSVEDTFAADVHTRAESVAVLERLAGKLGERLAKSRERGRTVVLKVKYADFRQITRSRTLTRSVAAGPDLLAVAVDLLEQTEVGRRPVRLLGIGLSHLDRGPRQLLLPFAPSLET